MKQIRVFILTLAVSIMATSIYPSGAVAETCKEWIAKVVSVQGSVQARRAGEEQWRTVRLNDIFCPGDMVRVQEQGRAAIALINESTLRLDQNTTVTFSQLEKGKTSLIDLITGIVHFFSRIPRTLKVATPFVNGTVEGTEFLVKVEKDRTFMSVFEGKVNATNEAGSIVLASGQSAVAEAGQAPVLRVVARPRDAVQWALYYPPIFSYRLGEPAAAPGTGWRTRVSLLLSVGRVDEARSEIEEALKADPGNGDALALQSIIAVVQNEKEKALSLAKKAVDANPNSASARVALSYAQQANFDLKGALDSLKDAVRLEPENALAWARLAEIRMSFGELDEALKAAGKAAALSPDLARTQTVLGFAHLTQIKTKQAKEEFEKAIELDQADPLPRLGLGLAKIRDGDLAEGRKEIEIAASLDPDNSLIRSYMGKAYYEEKRDKKASEQFSKAEEFDPLDPTPYFYDAIRKQSINRPVEALHDLQKSIELNDNREIYRSRLLLDEDLAARSASLARIYDDLGFQQLALVEGWKSENTDPGNYSAHRFLADSYSVLPRHEIARVSELLQSQLLQPININPVQPHLAESNLFILEGAGPSDPSFNEFNPLFNRNRLALQLSGVAGGNSTRGDEVVVSGIYDKFSISAGQFHYETDGFRENNDLKTDIYNIFAQYSLSPQTSVQAEFRYTETENGDLQLRFEPDNFFDSLRVKERTQSYRLGIHHAFSANSDLISSVIYKRRDADENIFAGFSQKGEENGCIAEIQHLFRSERIHLTSGLGYVTANQKIVATFFPFPETLDKFDIRHINLYAYTQINFPQQITWTIGGSADFFNDDTIERNQFNPKLGITWSPLQGTTLRAAVFRSLKRTLLSDQTLEPTQVAGFNQFFDDISGTASWRYGIGIDQKLSTSVYGGAEFSWRDMQVPFQDETTLEFKRAEWKEQVGRAYLYFTPYRWLAFSAEYQFERFDRPSDAPGEESIIELKTHRLPVGIKIFHPSGLGATLRATFVDQEGKFRDSILGVVPGEDQFVVVDASIGYRLPRRWGIISLEVKNLFNEKFKFQDTDPANPTIRPGRLILSRLTLAF